MFKINLANELKIELKKDVLIIKAILDKNGIGHDIIPFKTEMREIEIEEDTILGKDFK